MYNLNSVTADTVVVFNNGLARLIFVFSKRFGLPAEEMQII